MSDRLRALAAIAFLLVSITVLGCQAGADSPEPTATVTPVSPTPETTSAPTETPPSTTPTLTPDPRENVRVVDVIDGDTVILEGGRRLRYIGIDSPETVAPGQPVACYGPEASQRNRELLLGQRVTLETDVNNTDRYDRLLRYVYLPDGRMVNEVLVLEGFALSKAYPPDTKHKDRLDAAQDIARAAGRGYWGSCALTPSPTATPVVTPTPVGPPMGACPNGCETPPPGCAIKGNIGSARIYHVPGQRDYENTIIDPEKGERWFCTEDEAIDAGWRKAQR